MTGTKETRNAEVKQGQERGRGIYTTAKQSLPETCEWSGLIEARIKATFVPNCATDTWPSQGFKAAFPRVTKCDLPSRTKESPRESSRHDVVTPEDRRVPCGHRRSPALRVERLEDAAAVVVV